MLNLLKRLSTGRSRGVYALALAAVVGVVLLALPADGQASLQDGPAPGAHGKALEFEGEDSNFCFGLLPNVMGTNGDDLLIGTPDDDIIAGRGGDDIIYGMDGEDLICGGSGDDEIFGGRERDIVLAGTGDDMVSGGHGRDTILADRGNDWLIGNGGPDFLSGSLGDDVLIGGMLPHEEEDYPRSVPRDIFLGGLGDDVMIGGPGNDFFLAFSGNDIAIGAGGNDLLSGFNGDDYLDGGPGTGDECRGGAGADAAANCEVLIAIEMEGVRSFPSE